MKTRLFRLLRSGPLYLLLVLSLCSQVGLVAAWAQTPAVTQLPPDPAIFPTTQIGQTSASQNVQLQVNQALTISSITVPKAQGSIQEYAVGTISGCVADGATSNPAGAICTIPITFTPGYPGWRRAPLQLVTNIGKFSFGLNGEGSGPQAVLIPGIINTIAGNGTAGYGGDGGPARSAMLKKPEAMTTDYEGNRYIADTANDVVRKIDAKGIITTIAGTGKPGYNGDNIPATSAQLNQPDDLVFDSAGNLYIGDRYNFRTRKVDPNGIITTVVGNGTQGYTGDGGPAVNAEINITYTLSIDVAGNLYLPEYLNHVIRKVDAKGIITTIAGTGTAGFSGDGGPAIKAELFYPSAAIVDGAGNLFIADTYNNRIRKVDVNGVITTFAGTGAGGYNGDGGPATSAELNRANHLSVDAAGDVYINDINNFVIRKVDTSGIITTIVGNGKLGYSGDGGPATSAEIGDNQIWFDIAGNLYVVDYFNNVVRQINIADALTFPDTKVGSTSAPEHFTLANIGNDPLLASGLTASTNFTIDNSSVCSSSTTLNTGDSCIASVDFAPTVGGQLTGTATVTDNSLNAAGSTVVVPLSGKGITGTQPQTITFPPIPNQTYGVPPVPLNATSSSGLPVTYTVTGPGKLSGSTVVVTGTGTITVTATQPGNGTYAPATPVTRTFNVSPATLTVTADNVSRPVNQPNPALTYTITGFVNGDTPSVVSGKPVETTTATQTSPTGTYPITITQGTLAATNYVFKPVNGTLTVTNGSSQTITFPPIPNQTYGVPPIPLHGTSSSGLPVTYTVTGPGKLSGSTVVVTGAGTITVTATQPGNSSYPPATPVTRTFTVVPATLTVTAANVSRPYNQPDPALTYTITGFVNGDTPAVVTGAPVETTTATQQSPVGTYPITLTPGTLAATNYTFTPVNGTLTVTGLTQTINFPPLNNQTYGVGPIALSGTATSGLPVTYTVTGPGRLSGSTVICTGVGPITVTATQAGNNDYGAATPVSRVFIVAPAVLTVTAANATDTGGQPIPALSYAITGYVDGDTSAVVTGAPVETTTATAQSPGGTYPITLTQGTLAATNYTFTFVGGMLTVEDFTISSGTGPQTVKPGNAANYTINLAPAGASFDAPIQLSASDLPNGATYTFTPPTVTPGNAVAPTNLKIQTAALTQNAALAQPMALGRSHAILPIVMGVLFSLIGAKRMRKSGRKLQRYGFIFLLLLAMSSVVGGLMGCGGGFYGPQPKTYTITVTGTSGSLQHSTTVTLTVQ